MLNYLIIKVTIFCYFAHLSQLIVSIIYINREINKRIAMKRNKKVSLIILLLIYAPYLTAPPPPAAPPPPTLHMA